MNNRVNSVKAKAILGGLLLSAMLIPSQAASQAEGVEIRAQAHRRRNTVEVPGTLRGGDMTQSHAKAWGNWFKGSGTVARLQVGQLADTKTKILSALMSARASSFCANTGNAESGRLQWGLPVVFGTSCTRLSAVGVGTESVSAKLGPIGIRKAVSRLKRLNVKPLANGTYMGIAHPNALATMFGNPDWKQWNQNWSGGPTSTMYKHQAGLVHQVALVESSNQPRYAVAAHSCNITTILGDGCLAAAELDGSVKFLISRPGEQSTNDPFRLNSYIAFKVRMAGAVLDPSAGVHLITAEKVG